MPPRTSYRPTFWHHLSAITLLCPLQVAAQSPESSAHLRIPSSVTPIVRLAVGGRVRIITSDDPYLDVTAHVSLRGRTIGMSNGRNRPPYRLVSAHTGDTIVVTPAPRPSLRAVGLSWEREQLDHVILLPAGSHLLVEGNPSEVEIDGKRIPRCKHGRASWTRLTGAVCPVTVAERRSTKDEAFVYEGMLRLGTGAGAYPLRRAPKDRTLAHARNREPRAD